VYRVQAGDFADFQAAQQFCISLTARVDTGCLPLQQAVNDGP